MKAPKFRLNIFFSNKGLAFINLNLVLGDKQIRYYLKDFLKNDEVPSTAYSLANTKRNKIFN